MKAGAAFLTLLLASCGIRPAYAKPMAMTSIHDGDTLAVAGEWAIVQGHKIILRIPGAVNVRVLGIDTPEIGTRAQCPAENAAATRARDNLRAIVAANGGVVEIPSARHDKYGGRILADARVKAGLVATLQIAGGFAAAYSGEGPKRDWCGPENLIPENMR